jgi:hypothetical protein
MKITSKPLRILAMVGIGIVLALVCYAIAYHISPSGPSLAASSSSSDLRWVEVGGK